jgi:class 3 adenylate cyclase
VGVVGSEEKTDFTALGDTVNIAARLGGIAGPGELLVSADAWHRAGFADPPATRDVPIAGRTGTMNVIPIGATTAIPRLEVAS